MVLVILADSIEQQNKVHFFKDFTTQTTGNSFNSKHRHELLKLKSGSAKVLGYTVYRGFLNRVYGILQLKYGYSVYHFL